MNCSEPLSKRPKTDERFKSQTSLTEFFDGHKPKCDMAKKYGLKVYSQLKIDAARGQVEKEFRSFWNKEAELLARDARLRQLGKQEIYGIINTAWTLHKSSLLKLDVKYLEQLQQKVTDPDSRMKRKDDVIARNLSRMEVAHVPIESTHSKLKELKSSLLSLPPNSSMHNQDSLKQQIRETESHLHEDIHELKKSQETLKKATAKQVGDLKSHLESEQTKLEHADVCTDLDEDELACLVEEVEDAPFLPIGYVKSSSIDTSP